MSHTPHPSPPPCLVVVGASVGGIHALMQLAAALPPHFPAAVLVVQHVGALPNILPELLSHHGKNPARHGEQGAWLSAGTVVVAPPDHHLLVSADSVLISRGPKENHCRPAIDPLFRSAAFHWRERCIGVVLTGTLDDGSAGLAAIKACGGAALVQDPVSAQERSMPESALNSVEVDFCGDIAALAGELVQRVARLVAAPPPAPPALPEQVEVEVRINQGEDSMKHVNAIGTPSGFTCPDCGGALWEINDSKMLRYRCHIGHAYAWRSLAHAQTESAEFTLRASIRALREREMLLRRLAQVARTQGDLPQAKAGETEAAKLADKAERLTALVEEETAHRGA